MRAGHQLPVDATAARVVSKGIHYIAPHKHAPHIIESDVPIQVRPLPSGSREDLTGRKFGRFVVLGYHKPGRTGASWVVRCVCGNYAIRKPRAIKNPNNNDDACRRCRQTDFLKRRLADHESGDHVKYHQNVAWSQKDRP